MRLSTRGRYGVRALLDILLYGDGRPVNLKTIASRQAISTDYLEQLLRKLRRAGLVRSRRGPRGGFMLARDPREIHVWQILTVLEPEVVPVHCVSASNARRLRRKLCPRENACAAHLLWCNLADQMRDLLRAKSLHDLAEDSRKLERKAATSDAPATSHV